MASMPKIRPLHLVLGIEGVALIRNWTAGDEVVAPRIQEMARLLTDFDRHPLNITLDAPELDVTAGYAEWSKTYDEPGNPLIAAEEPAVRRLIDTIPVGTALDAACGTGRHASYLRQRGHRVVAADGSAEMLARARAKVPGADFCLGGLTRLPLAAASFDLAVCSLALDHVERLAPPIAELARVVRPGGWAIISDIHPILLLLGGGAFFQGEDRNYAAVREFYHAHSEYVAALVSAGFDIRECIEPQWTERELAMTPRAVLSAAPDAFREARLGTPIALVWLAVRR
jgi:SAM-dependent methyltransferase